jgi:predicted nucleic acid-binding protein
MSGVLVDTSVWINHFRNVPSLPVAELQLWLDEDPDRVLLNEVVVTELLRGVRDEAEAARMRALLEELPQAEPLQRDDWLASADIYRTCRQAGLTIRSPMDCLIAAHAMRLRRPVMAVDRDFDAIASCLPLALHRSLPQ